MKLVVVDSSVLVAFFTAEKKTPNAIAALEAVRAGNALLAAPPFHSIEVANALRRKVGQKEIDSERAAAIFELLFRMRIVALDADVRRGLTLAIRFQHSVYDCIYLALAEELDCELLTADEKFWRKLGGTYPRIRRI